MFTIIRLVMSISSLWKTQKASEVDISHAKQALKRLNNYQNGSLNLQSEFNSKMENYFDASIAPQSSAQSVTDYLWGLTTNSAIQNEVVVYQVLPVSETQWLLCCSVKWVDSEATSLSTVQLFTNACYAELAVTVTGEGKRIRVNGPDYRSLDERGGLQQAAYKIVSGLLIKK
jgi:hypothetical protein